ncbi:gamma-butyrobetaine hydroxylase-like domain-containing protein [Roseiterribacter gracilis]|uniref:Gamma-butyrobetaine hydroxylase-like N-terminal domain-containing protein n=1 Tax=Roseiterribacter gracilis TaxID=2812848 RepID=A0A8S8XAP4_9PROT|nr:hypothetical protein TMPK1_27800 [Rhodospirillales bacterium TMPK1]
MTDIWPSEIKFVRATQTLEIDFDDGTRASLPAEYLRVESPSAEVQGHGAGPKQLVTGKRDVTIDAVEPIGNYAVRLRFSDGHDTGLYSWSYLHLLGREQAARWADYLKRLDAAGARRDPAMSRA